MSDERAAGPGPAMRNAWFMWFLILATAMLCALVFVLSRQNAGLRSEVAALRQSAGEAALPRGETLAELEAFGPASEPVAGLPAEPMAFGDGRLATVLLIHTSTCGACEAMLPEMARLLARHRPLGVEFFAIQIDATGPDELRHVESGVPMRGVPGGERTWLRRVPLVPATLVVDAEGVLRHAQYGAPDERQWDALRSELDTISGAGRDAPGAGEAE